MKRRIETHFVNLGSIDSLGDLKSHHFLIAGLWRRSRDLRDWANRR